VGVLYKMGFFFNNNNYTQTEVTANRPDIIIKNKEEKTCTRKDVAKDAEKKLQYKS